MLHNNQILDIVTNILRKNMTYQLHNNQMKVTQQVEDAYANISDPI